MISTVLGMALIGIAWGKAPAAWHTDYSKAHAEATAGDKPLFIVFCSGSSQYGRLIALGMFLNEDIERSLQADYVRFMVDTDTPSGTELAKRFEAGEGPHFVILDRSGRWQIFYQSGYLLESDLTPVLATFRRTKLAANGKPIREVADRPVARVCST